MSNYKEIEYMRERKDRESALYEIYGAAIERQGTIGQIRSVQVTIPGKEITLAHIIGSPDEMVYRNLGLDIGFHEGVKPQGSLGIINVTPPESAVIAADIAVKAGDVDIGFMDRFSGALIITGRRSDVEQAMREILEYFSEKVNYGVCRLTAQ